MARASVRYCMGANVTIGGVRSLQDRKLTGMSFLNLSAPVLRRWDPTNHIVNVRLVVPILKECGREQIERGGCIKHVQRRPPVDLVCALSIQSPLTNFLIPTLPWSARYSKKGPSRHGRLLERNSSFRI
jgi:hypothetical protein